MEGELQINELRYFKNELEEEKASIYHELEQLRDKMDRAKIRFQLIDSLKDPFRRQLIEEYLEREETSRRSYFTYMESQVSRLDELDYVIREIDKKIKELGDAQGSR